MLLKAAAGVASQATQQLQSSFFPNLDSSKPRQLGPDAGINSRVCGTSKHKPNPADVVGNSSAAAPQGALVILPGHAHPVPLQSLFSAGLLLQPGNSSQQANCSQLAAPTGNEAGPGAGWAPGVAAAAAAGLGDPATAAAVGAAWAQNPAASLFSHGRVSEADRKAAMAKGMSSAAAGAGGVPSPTSGMAATAEVLLLPLQLQQSRLPRA